MGKTFRRNEGRRPKWDKRGKKSHKVREYEDEKCRYQPRPLTPPPENDGLTGQEDWT